jgi:hypothetical protein
VNRGDEPQDAGLILLKPLEGCRSPLPAGKVAVLHFEVPSGNIFYLTRAISAIPGAGQVRVQLLRRVPDADANPARRGKWDPDQERKFTLAAPWQLEPDSESPGATPAELEESLDAWVAIEALTGACGSRRDAQPFPGTFVAALRNTGRQNTWAVFALLGWLEV